MSEKIFLTYTNATAVPYHRSVLGHHIVLNYIDSNGVHRTLQGVPEHGFHHNIGFITISMPINWRRWHSSCASSAAFKKSLTRRANHRHIFIIARISKPAPGNRPRAFSILA